jgi:hypothetical protein
MDDPLRQEIELRAYQIWQERGSPSGTPETDWFKAEQKLAKPEAVLSNVAREVGAAVGSVVALLSGSGR